MMLRQVAHPKQQSTSLDPGFVGSHLQAQSELDGLLQHYHLECYP